MNQAINTTPYGLLTEEEQAQFCKEAKQRGMYEYYNEKGEWITRGITPFSTNFTYRLKMVKGEIYYVKCLDGTAFFFKSDYKEGGNLTQSSSYMNPNSPETMFCNSCLTDNDDIKTLRPVAINIIRMFNEPEEENCPKCGKSLIKAHWNGNWICSCVTCTYIDKPKKEKWYYWHEGMGKEPPKKDTYKKACVWSGLSKQWNRIQPNWEKDTLYRYKKVKK